LIELVAHDPAWSELAEREAARMHEALRAVLLDVHHIGSTAIPGIVAKPIIDLIPVVSDLASLDAARARIEALGYDWRGEFGIAGRRFCLRDDPNDGRRLVQAHFFADGDPQIERHIAFRDYLRANREVALEYEALKVRLAAEYTSSLEYADAKTPWIRSVESAAINFYRATTRYSNSP
jgi:GrpB-like predicted nucleotidyltransferase (UPF0157 family)